LTNKTLSQNLSAKTPKTLTLALSQGEREQEADRLPSPSGRGVGGEGVHFLSVNQQLGSKITHEDKTARTAFKEALLDLLVTLGILQNTNRPERQSARADHPKIQIGG